MYQMGESFTKRDREAAREIHRLFRSAWFQDTPTFFAWAITRPAALFVYNVLIPFAVAYGLQAIVTKDFNAVPRYALAVLILALIYCVLWGLGGVAVIINAKVCQIYLRQKIFENFLNKDYEFLNNTFLGSLGSQATRLGDALDEYDQLLFNGFLKQIIIVVTSVAIIAYQSPLLAIITITSMAIVLGFTIIITRWRIKYRRILSEASSEMAGVIGDALSHGTTVKSFAAEDYEKKHLSKSLYKYVDAQYWSWMTSIPADLGRMFLAAVATFLLLIFTSQLYQQNKISIAIVVLVQLYVVKLVIATQDIADLIKNYEAVMSAAHQAMKTMLIKPTIVDKENPQKFPRKLDASIGFEGVTFQYSDAAAQTMAVRKFSLHIKQGQKIGLVGYSGSGKTTLTKLLLRFMDVTKGSIKIAGLDIRDVAQKELRKLIAYVPQEPLLFHRSIKENIAYGKPTARTKDIEMVGKAAYVDEFVKELKNGYETFVGERGVKLSGGQRQRVAIARALLKDAPILILDEATSSLDSKSEKYIQKGLWKLMKGRTALVIAHRLSTIQQMDRIVVVDKGQVVQTGTHKELLKDKNGIYAKLWAHQSGGYIGLPTK